MSSDTTPHDVPSSSDGAASSPSAERAKTTRPPWRSRGLYLRVLAILAVIGITATSFVFRDHVTDLQALGYLGAFLISLITSATLVLPIPGIAIVFALGAVHNPVLIGLAAGAGSALGEITGYMAGYSGQIVVERSRVYRQLEAWMKRRGSIVILVLSFVPNPLFDLAGAAAGVLKYPVWKFLLFCFLGKTPRNILVAFAGAWALDDVLRFIHRYF